MTSSGRVGVFRLLLLFAVLAVAGCVSAPDSFLVTKLDAQAKATALVNQGVQQYQIQLIRRGDLSKLAAVREYFTMALRFDPGNLLAARYRDLVDNFKTARINQALREAQAYLAKPKRHEEEDYALCLDIQIARRLDPGNATAARLAKDTEGIRQGLITSYFSKAKASLDLPAKASAADRENADVAAYQDYSRVLSLDPGNAAAAGQLSSLRQELDRMAQQYVAGIKRLVAAGQYESAGAQVAQLEQIDRRLGGILGSRVTEASYTLDYQWARSLYARRMYVQADVKVNDALSVMRTDEALALKKKIAEPAAQLEQQASLDASLQQIDSLIDEGELAAASSRVEALAKRTDDQQRLDQLDSRRQKIHSFLPGMYDKAVQDYRDEDFKAAVELLRTIVSIDVGFEQAADYLDKATAKEKLLEQF